jgi:hypothetical protein
MPEHDLKDLLESPRYRDRGGWKILTLIFRANLPYELKLANVQETFKVSRATANKWYTRYRSLVGLR